MEEICKKKLKTNPLVICPDLLNNLGLFSHYDSIRNRLKNRPRVDIPPMLGFQGGIMIHDEFGGYSYSTPNSIPVLPGTSKFNSHGL